MKLLSCPLSCLRATSEVPHPSFLGQLDTQSDQEVEPGQLGLMLQGRQVTMGVCPSQTQGLASVGIFWFLREATNPAGFFSFFSLFNL